MTSAAVRLRWWCGAFLCSCALAAIPALRGQELVPVTGPAPELFAPGVISGPGNDGSPTFSSDGNTLFFTRSAAHWTAILESHREGSGWSKPVLAPFSGVWPDSSPAMSPDGTYIVFQSIRPVAEVQAGKPAAKPSNLWRVDRVGDGWSEPRRLPKAVNFTTSIWKPSIARDGTVYFTVVSAQGKRLYGSRFSGGQYAQAQPLPFSDGTQGDVDPEISPDGSFLLFCSSGRLKGDDKDHLFFVRRQGDGWGPVTQMRYAGEDKPYGWSTDNEPHLGPGHRAVYFSSDRSAAVHFPRTRPQAERDLDAMDQWDNGNTNIWVLPLAPWIPDRR